MDRGFKRIEPSSVMITRSSSSKLGTLGAFSLVFAMSSVFGCGGQTPPPDNVDTTREANPDEGGGMVKKPGDEPAPPDNDTIARPHGAKKTTDDAVADYTLTERDCVELGKHYVVVQRADQVKALDAKLTAKQRETAEKNIDAVVGPMGEPWANGCIENLTGKVVERKRLECAMSSKDVKGFGACLNEDLPK